MSDMASEREFASFWRLIRLCETVNKDRRVEGLPESARAVINMAVTNLGDACWHLIEVLRQPDGALRSAALIEHGKVVESWLPGVESAFDAWLSRIDSETKIAEHQRTTNNLDALTMVEKSLSFLRWRIEGGELPYPVEMNARPHPG